MIVHGGEPPFVEEPNPRFGGVISKLNEISFFVQEQTTEFNEGTKGRLHEFADSMTAFINEVVIPVAAHVNSRGAVHGETKKTISLGLKDNFRTATLAEQIALANVNAFVTPQGAKQSIAVNNGVFVADSYQRNDALQLASYFYPDDYPTSPPTVPEPVRYMLGGEADGRIPMLVNGDRMVLSVRHNSSRYQRQSLYVSGPVKATSKTQLEEIQNVNNYYTGLGWNNVAGKSSAGTVGFFYPIADKKIYEFKDATEMPESISRAYLLYRGYGGSVYKGLSAVLVNVSSTQFTINHRFFYVDALETDPTMHLKVPGTYRASFETMGGNNGLPTGPAQGQHSYNILDFITLPQGAVASMSGDSQGPTVTLLWNSQDYEAYLFIAIGLTIRYPSGGFQYVTLRFVESIIPGTLETGGTAAFKTLGVFVKDVIPLDAPPPDTSQWVEPGNRWNVNSPVHLPGCVLDNGEVVRSRAGKYSIRVKRFRTEFKGLKAWIMGKRPVVNVRDVTTEVMTPARHAPFGPLPERILLTTSNTDRTSYLIYGLDLTTGRCRWKEMTWNTSTPIGVTTGSKSGLRLPDVITSVDGLAVFPTAMSTVVNTVGVGVSSSALGFTKNNNYRGYSGFSYINGVLSLTGDVSLSPATLISLQATLVAMMARARARSPLAPLIDRFRVPQIQVFAVTSTKAVFMLTDGICHVEVGVAPWSIINGKFVLDFINSGGVKTTIVTAPTTTVTGLYRESGSGDNVQMFYNDLNCVQMTADKFAFVASRPFGDLYADVSFTIDSFVTADIPTITTQTTNPIRMYQSDVMVDAVDELPPAFTVPAKGVYQYSPGNGYSDLHINIANHAEGIDPFDINDTGWVRVPSGAKAVINGRAYIMDRDYAVKVNPTGVSYCYLVRNGDTLTALASPTVRETTNNEILFGVATNGVLSINHEYLVLNNHLLSNTRRGSAVPYFEDDGALGTNKFFTQRDRI